MAKLGVSSEHSQWNLGTSGDNLGLKKQTLMIVDDCQGNLDAMNALFDFQYKVVLQNSAKDAIKYAILHDVDLILLDVDMPGMNGYEACASLKSNELTAHISIIFVTGAGSPEQEEKGLLLGAVDYVVKPLNFPILNVRVRNHMELVYCRKQLEILSSVDGLTGAVNRRQLDTMLLQHYASTIRYGNYLALLMVDIDNFKLYNDTYGHIKGDKCLQQVAKTIMSAKSRETDIVGRYGGEEFAVVLPDTDIAGASVIADRLLKNVRELNIEHSSSPNKIVTVSIGLAIFEAKHASYQELTLEEFIHQADTQLYAAKRNGKDCVRHAAVSVGQ
jgi:diguanylate cyclase (GGDEF)-like protein